MAKFESERDTNQICNVFGFCPLPDMKYEPKEVDKYTMSYNIASKHQHIGIIVKVDRNLISKSY